MAAAKNGQGVTVVEQVDKVDKSSLSGYGNASLKAWSALIQVQFTRNAIFVRK